MSDDALLEQIMTPAQTTRLRQILSNTPVAALPHGGMGYGLHPATVEHVLDIMDSMADELRTSLAKLADLNEQYGSLRSDLAAVGRIIVLNDAVPAPIGFEPVRRIEAGELEKFIGYLTDWQGRRWTINTLRSGLLEQTVRIELTRLVGEDLQVYVLEVNRDAPVDIYPPKPE